MSWSVHASGKAGDIAPTVQAEIARYQCAMPEQKIKEGVARIIADALGAMAPEHQVTVSAHGSQHEDPSAPGKFVNTLNVSVQ